MEWGAGEVMGGAALLLTVAKWALERRKLVADTGLTFEQLDKLRRERIEELETVVEDSVGTARKKDVEIAMLRAERDSLEARVRRLEAILPMALIAQRLEDLGGLRILLDALSDPIVATSAARQGSIIWANRAFCACLQRPLEEVLALGWRGMIHPDDAAETEGVESSAWDLEVAEFVNRYIRADGGIVWFRWLCPRYKAGVTLALARPQRVQEPNAKEEPSHDPPTPC